MKKSDLKTGMLVQYRKGDVGIVINNFIIEDDTWLNLNCFNDDLTSISYKKHDILKVSDIQKSFDLIPHHWTNIKLNENILWERTPEKTFEIDGVEYSQSTLRSIIKKATGKE